MPLKERYQNVILVLVDALSLANFQRLFNQSSLPFISDLRESGVIAPLTSITPSTTVAALTTLWTGRSAAEHGQVGYEMWLKKYGVVVNAILHTPSSFQGRSGSLMSAGLDPESFISVPRLGAHLADHAIQTYAFQHQSIARSSLSRMLLQEVRVNSFRTSADLWVNVRQILKDHSQTQKYIWIYWGEVDNFAHHYGPEDERTSNEVMNFFSAFQNLFLDRLKPKSDQDTLIILLADHGQIKTQPDPIYNLRNHSKFIHGLHIMPTGENRLAYLHQRPDQGWAIEEYIEKTWPGQFAFIEPALAVESGLFGPGERHPDLFERLGDLIVVARGNAYLWWSPKNDHLYGRHGGLSAEEMLVPFLALNL
jgi:predicted AlkP superfamily pyrophosphatase or phosphodiesterase